MAISDIFNFAERLDAHQILCQSEFLGAEILIVSALFQGGKIDMLGFPYFLPLVHAKFN